MQHFFFALPFSEVASVSVTASSTSRRFHLGLYGNLVDNIEAPSCEIKRPSASVTPPSPLTANVNQLLQLGMFIHERIGGFLGI